MNNNNQKIVLFTQWVIRWRYLIILSTLILVALLGSGIRFLQFNNDYRMFFGEDNPELQAYEHLQNTYTKNDNVFIALAPRSGQIFSQASLTAVKYITDRAWQIPYSIRVDSISNFQNTYAEGDNLIVDDLLSDDRTLSEDEINRIKTIATHEPQLIGKLINSKGSMTAVNVTVELPGKNSITESPQVIDAVRQIVKEFKVQYPDIDVYLTGMMMINNAFPEASQHDAQQLVPLAFSAILLVLILLFRSISATLITLTIILFSIIPAMGLAGWLGISLSPPLASAPIIILTLSIADCVHILIPALQNIRSGEDKVTALIESMRINFQPILLTSLTTALGFLTLNFSDTPPFHDLGNIASFGVLVAFFLAVVFLPAVFSIVPVRTKIKQDFTVAAMKRFSLFVVSKRTPLFWGMSAAIVVIILFIPKNELDDNFVKYFDHSVKFRVDTDYIEDHMTGMAVIDYSIDSGVANGIANPKFLHDLDNLSQWIRKQPEVFHVNTITDIFKRLNMNMHTDRPEKYTLPDDQMLAAQYLLLYEMSLPYGLDLNNQINIDKSATRLSVTLRNLTSREFLTFENHVYKWMQVNAPDIATHGSSPTIMFAHIGQRNIASMLFGTTAALLLISLVLIVALRSVKYGIISLAPNLLPAAIAFGLWGIIVGQVGMSLSIVAAMTLGIVVDDTVHFLSKYIRARQEQNLDAIAAVRYAFSSVGVALVVTSVCLIAGFSILALSPFELNSGMGMMTSIIISIALIVDFLFLPPLLIKIEEYL